MAGESNKVKEMIHRIDVIKELVYLPHPALHYCAMPYNKSKYGCPNIGSRACLQIEHNHGDRFKLLSKMEEIIDTSKSMWLVSVRFDIESHAYAMKLKHPAWTDTQCRCLLYWQNTVKKTLKQCCDEFISKQAGEQETWIHNFRVFYLPEAYGLNIGKIFFKATGIPLKWPPKQYVWKVALVGNSITDGRKI
jgi:hypothetical protein